MIFWSLEFGVKYFFHSLVSHNFVDSLGGPAVGTAL